MGNNEKNWIDNFKLSRNPTQSLQLLRCLNWDHQIGSFWWNRRSQAKKDSTWRGSHWGYAVQAGAQRYHQSSSLECDWALIRPLFFSVSISVCMYIWSLPGLNFRNICALCPPWFPAPLVEFLFPFSLSEAVSGKGSVGDTDSSYPQAQKTSLACFI